MSWTDVKNKILSLNPSFYSTLGRKDGNIDLSENSYSMLTQGSMVIGNSIEDPIRLRGYGSTEFDGIDDRIITGYGTRRNLCTNPRGGAGATTGWSNAGFSPAPAVTTLPTRDGLPENFPDSAFVATADGSGDRADFAFPVISGRTYTVSVYTRIASGGSFWRVGVLNPANSVKASTSNFTTVGGAFVRRSITFVADATETWRVFVGQNGGTTPAQIHWTGVLVEETSELRAFFDGDGYVDEQGSWHSDNGGHVGWTGTPYASPSDMGAFANGTTRTFTGWAYLDDDTTWHTLLGGDDPDAAPLLNISDSGDVNFWPNFEDEVLWEDSWPGTGEWVHWALVFDEAEDEAELFINGESQGVESTNLQYVESPGNFQIAAYTDGTAELWDGKQAHVAVFERALTPEEIAEIYDLAINPPPIPFSEHDAEIVLLNPEEYGIVVLNEGITGFETNTDVNN